MNSDLPSLKSKFPPLLHLTYLLQQSTDDLLTRQVGVGLSHVRIMSGLSSVISRSQHHLAVELQQTEANISRQLQIMKKHGLVSISRNKQDGRQRDVRLTKKGETKYKKAEELLKKEQRGYRKLVASSLV